MSRVTRSNMEMLEQTLNATLSQAQAPTRIKVGKDIAGYHIYRVNLNGEVERTLKYGETPQKAYLYLDGMLVGLYQVREALGI